MRRLSGAIGRGRGAAYGAIKSAVSYAAAP